MEKISILALHLHFGGTEKAICNLANMLVNDYCVEIAVVYKMDDNEAFYLDPRVKVVYLSDMKPNRDEFVKCLKSRNLFSAFKEGLKALKVLRLRKSLIKDYVKKCDASVIVSSRYLFNGILGKFKKDGVVTIAQEHCHHNDDVKYIKKIVKSVRNIDYLMPVSQELSDDYARYLKDSKCRVVYIRHVLDYWPEEVNYNSDGDFVVVSRLSKEKGIIDLVDVMEVVAAGKPEIKLNVFGDGTEKEKILERIKSKGLEDVMVLHGFQKKEVINKYLSNSSIFLLGSLEESFGLVVIEAMSFGVPCISFDTAQGVREIINEKNGVMVANRDKDEMARVALRMSDDKVLLERMSKEARKTAENYRMDVVKKEWLSFLEEVRNDEGEF